MNGDNSQNLRTAIDSLAISLRNGIDNTRTSLLGEIDSRVKAAVESNLSQLKRDNQPSDGALSSENNSFNYTTRGTYEGQEVKFAISGQVLTPSEESEFGNVNYIEFGGGGASSCIGLALFSKTVGTPPNTSQQVWISSGTVAGQVPSGMDTINGQVVSSGGSGQVWATVVINPTNGDLVSVAIDSGGSVPTNTNSNFHYSLGAYAYSGDFPTVTNYGCGSLDVNICRNWFATAAPFYGVSFSR